MNMCVYEYGCKITKEKKIEEYYKRTRTMKNEERQPLGLLFVLVHWLVRFWF